MIPSRHSARHWLGSLLVAAFLATGCSKGSDTLSDAVPPSPAEQTAPLASSQHPMTANPAGRPATPAVAPAGRKVTVTVQLSPALKSKVAPGNALYIFARSAQGPAMPLAIVRKQAGDLPATVTLDDSTAMMPEYRLSNFPEVVVGARISKTGDAIAKPGDLEGFSAPTRNNKVEVTIASVVGTSAAKPAGGSPHAGTDATAFNHSSAGGKTRLNIPAEVKAKWKTAELAVSGPGTSAHTVKATIGGETKLENGLLLKVLAYVPAFRSDNGVVTSASNNPDNPAVLLQLVDKQQVLAEGWVFQKLPDFNTFSSVRLKAQLVGAAD